MNQQKRKLEQPTTPPLTQEPVAQGAPEQIPKNQASGAGMVPGGRNPEEGGKKMTPEQQQQFDLFISNGRKIVQEAGETILKQIQVQDPIDGIASATVMVIGRLEQVALEAGTQLDPDVEIQAANGIMGEIIGLYEKNGGQPLDEQQRYQAFSLAVSMYLDEAVKTGKISKEELTQMSDMMKKTPEGQQIAKKMEQSAARGTGQGGTKGGGNKAPPPRQPKAPQRPGFRPGKGLLAGQQGRTQPPQGAGRTGAVQRPPLSETGLLR